LDDKTFRISVNPLGKVRGFKPREDKAFSPKKPPPEKNTHRLTESRLEFEQTQEH